MTAQELKNSILQYAVQGKLIPQDPNDEPASALLKRIKAEKQQLIKDKKIKAEKPLAPIKEEEIPFEIPESWEWVRLGDAFNIIMGQSPDGKSVSNSTNGIEFHQGKVFFSKKYILKSDQTTNEPSKIAEANSVLLCVRAPVGIVNITNRVLCIGRGLCSVKPLAKMTAEFVFYMLETYKQIFVKQATGTTFVAITGEVVKNQLFPLPPLAEQARIVAKIEEFVPLVEKYDKAEKELTALNNNFPEQIKKSILQYAIQGKLVPAPSPLERAGGEVNEPASELLKKIKAEKAQLIKEKKIKAEKPLPPIKEDEIPFEIPESWEWVRLGEVCNFGKNESILANNISDNEWLLELEDIEKETGRIIEFKLKKERNSISNKNKFKKGAVLYSKLRPYLNKVVVVENDGYCSSEIFPLEFGNNIYNKYAQIFFMSPHFVEFATQKSYGTKMPRFGSKDGQNALFALPPFSEQKRIVEKVEELLAACEKLK